MTKISEKPALCYLKGRCACVAHCELGRVYNGLWRDPAGVLYSASAESKRRGARADKRYGAIDAEHMPPQPVTWGTLWRELLRQRPALVAALMVLIPYGAVFAALCVWG